jgi:hypothetical protein
MDIVGDAKEHVSWKAEGFAVKIDEPEFPCFNIDVFESGRIDVIGHHQQFDL